MKKEAENKKGTIPKLTLSDSSTEVYLGFFTSGANSSFRGGAEKLLPFQEEFPVIRCSDPIFNIES